MDTREQLYDWLARHHRDESGFWLVQWRSVTGRRVIAYEDVIEVCLIFGWIDSTVQTLDEQRSAIRLTPRRPTSVWSKSNKQRLARLESAGLMQPAGLAAVEAAKVNGMFNFLDDVEALEVPEDLAAALGGLRDVFDGFPPGRRRQLLYWIKSAKRPGTRSARIAKIVADAGQGRSST